MRRFPNADDDFRILGAIHEDLRPATSKGALRAFLTCQECGEVAELRAMGSKKNRWHRRKEAVFPLDQEYDDVRAVVRLCSDCMGRDAQATITRTDAKKRYMLTDDQLDGLPCLVKVNPHYKKAPPMNLFLVSMARLASLKRFGSYEAMEAEQERREAIAAKRRSTIEARWRENPGRCKRRRLGFHHPAFHRDDDDDDDTE